MKSKRAAIKYGTIEGWMIAIILFVVLFEVLAALFPTLTSAGDTLNSSGFPLASLFTSGGAGWYILAVGVVVLLFRSMKTQK